MAGNNTSFVRSEWGRRLLTSYTDPVMTTKRWSNQISPKEGTEETAKGFEIQDLGFVANCGCALVIPLPKGINMGCVSVSLSLFPSVGGEVAQMRSFQRVLRQTHHPKLSMLVDFFMHSCTNYDKLPAL